MVKQEQRLKAPTYRTKLKLDKEVGGGGFVCMTDYATSYHRNTPLSTSKNPYAKVAKFDHLATLVRSGAPDSDLSDNS